MEALSRSGEPPFVRGGGGGCEHFHILPLFPTVHTVPMNRSYWPAIGGHGPCAHKCGAECTISLFPRARGGVNSLVLWERYRHCERTLGTA